MANTFKAGDVVQLNSGGPKMTVTSVGDNYGTPAVWCMWFDKTKQQTGVFPINTVNLWSEPPSPQVITRRPRS